MKILTIINHPNDPPGVVGERIEARGGEWLSLNPHDGGAIPSEPDGYDGIVVLGGAMSAGDDANYPAFPPLIDLLRQFHRVEKPALGICLGAQLLARVFDKPVFPHREFEFGFRPLELTPACARDPLFAGEAAVPPIFQWHEDTFELPDQAALLMTGAACHNQAYRVGNSTYGFQCHFEVTDTMIVTWMESATTSLEKRFGDAAGAVVAQVRREIPEHLGHARAFAARLTDRWLDMVEWRKRDGDA